MRSPLKAQKRSLAIFAEPFYFCVTYVAKKKKCIGLGLCTGQGGWIGSEESKSMVKIPDNHHQRHGKEKTKCPQKRFQKRKKL